MVDFAWYSAIQGGQGEPENFVEFERSELIAIKNFMEHSYIQVRGFLQLSLLLVDVLVNKECVVLDCGDEMAEEGQLLVKLRSWANIN